MSIEDVKKERGERKKVMCTSEKRKKASEGRNDGPIGRNDILLGQFEASSRQNIARLRQNDAACERKSAPFGRKSCFYRASGKNAGKFIEERRTWRWSESGECSAPSRQSDFRQLAFARDDWRTASMDCQQAPCSVKEAGRRDLMN